jgi:asparagine synthase (glutamine-hydrolysing)
MSLDFRLKRTLRGMDHPAHLRLPVWMAPLAPSELNELFATPLDLDDVYSEAIDAWDNCASTDPIERTIAFYIRLYLQDDILVKVDRASMLHSLEVRAPFLDIDVVDFLRKLPSRMKLRGSTSKWILRQGAEALLPREVLTRSKQGFALPIGTWLASGKLGNVDTISGNRAAFWRRKLAEQRAHAADHRLYLWSEIALRESALWQHPNPQTASVSTDTAIA